MAQSASVLDKLVDDISYIFRLFDAAGDLTRLTPVQLFYLTRLIQDGYDVCVRLLREHERSRPSVFWVLVSFFSGAGGLLFLEPNIASIVITGGGVAGAAKSVYDQSMYLASEQRYLRLYWELDSRKSALEVELRRRGLL